MELIDARLRLRSARLAAGFTQRELADKAGISQSFVAQIESGEREPGRKALRALAEALGTSVSWLLGEPVGALEGNYIFPSELKKILADRRTPPGLRSLAADHRLLEVLGITDPEWRALASIELPSPATKDGYINLLLTVRAIASNSQSFTSPST